MNKCIRHGEALLVPVKEFPAKAKVFTSYVVSHSETGHHHVLESKHEFEVAVDKEDLYLRLFEPAKLVHKKSVDKHNTLTVAPGRYKVVYKTEYNPWEQVISRVFD